MLGNRGSRFDSGWLVSTYFPFSSKLVEKNLLRVIKFSKRCENGIACLQKGKLRSRSPARKFVFLLLVSSCYYFGASGIGFWVILLFSQTVWSHPCETLREQLLADPDIAGDAFSLSKLKTRITQSWRKLRLTFLSGTIRC